MAELRSTFLEGLEIAFDIFEEAVSSCVYTLPNENEFDDSDPQTNTIRCLFTQLKDKDVALLSFSELIQQSDLIGLVPYDDLTLPMSNKAYCVFDEGTYTVVQFESDPMKVVYIVLFRKN